MGTVSSTVKDMMTSNSGNLSSKRILASILIFFGIVTPIICIFIEPLGVIDDSILILSAQFLVSGCSLLGFTLKEVTVPALANRRVPATRTASVVVNQVSQPVEDDMTDDYDVASSSSRSASVMNNDLSEEVYRPEYTKRNRSSKCIG